jgi:ATP-dependent Lhr-like helicase
MLKPAMASDSSIKYMDTPYTKEDIFSVFHPLMQEWFSEKYLDFSRPQLYSIFPIHNRENILISAPTGTGKTLSAFSAILNELIDSSVKGILRDEIYCVYVSPLKALNEDIRVNLLEPLSELEEMYGQDLGIRVAVRTGDTTQYQRTKMLKKPPHILITTPESLSILLSSPKFSQKFGSVSWVIIDEIHSIAENKRGTHLSLCLEWLASKAQHITRVGLSATVAPLERIAHYLVGNCVSEDSHTGDTKPNQCLIANPGNPKKLELNVRSATANVIDASYEEIDTNMYEILDEVINKYRTTLVFTNTRAATEKVVHNLKYRFPEKYGDANVEAHHSSLSKEQRHRVEQGLRAGEYKCIVSSTSLELGIDIGSVDVVVLLGSPKSASRAIQRVGRSGHRLEGVARGVFLVSDRDDLVECSIIQKLMYEKKIDRVQIPTNCLDVLAQQIVGFVMNRVWDEDELFSFIKRSYAYSDLTRSDYHSVLEYLAAEYGQLENRHVYAKIWRRDGKLGKRGRLTRLIYATNVGTIPQEESVIVKYNEAVVGYVEEAFLENLTPRSVFVLAGRTFRFRYSKGNVAFVVPEVYNPPNIPSWYSAMLPLSFDTASAIQRFRKLVNEHIREKQSKQQIVSFIAEHVYVNKETAQELYYYFVEQYTFSLVPHTNRIVVETILDEEDRKIVFHTLFGRRVNDCLSRLIGLIISRFLHKDVEIGINDNCFYVSYDTKLDIDRVIRILKMQEDVYGALETAIDKSEVLKRTFRHCANRSFMILKTYKGQEKSVGRQIVSTQILINAVRAISNDFCVLKEARREVLADKMDIYDTIDVIDKIKAGTIAIEKTENTIPSPFAFNIVLQGYSDVLKADDRQAFLRRMHSYVIAKIAKDVPKEDLEALKPKETLDGKSLSEYVLEKTKHLKKKKPTKEVKHFSYEEFWKEHDEKKAKEQEEYQDILMMDLQKVDRRLHLDPQIKYDIGQLIQEKNTRVRHETVSFLEELLSGTVPKIWTDRLVTFLMERLKEIK